MTRLFPLMILLALGVNLLAQKPQTSRHDTLLMLTAGQDSVYYSYSIYPAYAPEPHPAIILFPDLLAGEQEVELLANRFTQAGHTVYVPLSWSRPSLRGAQSPNTTMNHAANWAFYQKLAAQRRHSIGFVVIGMGNKATDALMLSTQASSIQATFLFYVHEPLAPVHFARLRTPVYMFVGENEPGREKFVNHMQKYMYANGKSFFPNIIPGVKAGFMTHALGSEANLVEASAMKNATYQILGTIKP